MPQSTLPHPLEFAEYAIIEPFHSYTPTARQDDRPAVVHWQSLIDRGLIGTRPPVDPAVAANRDRTDALFRSFARR